MAHILQDGNSLIAHHLETLLRSKQSSPYTPHVSLSNSLGLWPLAHKITLGLHFATHHTLTTATCAPSCCVVHVSLARATHEKNCVCSENFNLYFCEIPTSQPQNERIKKLLCFIFQSTLVLKYCCAVIKKGAKSDWDFQISDLVKNPDETYLISVLNFGEVRRAQLTKCRPTLLTSTLGMGGWSGELNEELVP